MTTTQDLIARLNTYATGDEYQRDVEAAVIARLAARESVEPVGYLDGQGDAYTLDQLRTAIAAARVQALEDAMDCYSPDDSATDWMDKIRALIGAP